MRAYLGSSVYPEQAVLGVLCVPTEHVLYTFALALRAIRWELHKVWLLCVCGNCTWCCMCAGAAAVCMGAARGAVMGEGEMATNVSIFCCFNLLRGVSGEVETARVKLGG